MPYEPIIYDWRYSCAPIDQVFRAGGQSIQGAMTLGGFTSESPEPGGRGELVMNFATFATEEANLDASWTISRIMNGNIMRIRLYQSIQLVKDELLGEATTEGGIPWDNEQPWGNGQNWSYSPSARITVSALAGSTSFVTDLGPTGPVLKIGHVVGFNVDGYDFCHEVMDISYGDDDVAEVEVSPPLRRDLAPNNHRMLFRPIMLLKCVNAREVMTNFRSGRHMTFSTARFVEVLV